MNIKALVILSGGMDSVTTLYRAFRDEKGAIEAISFYYGQRHNKELKLAQKNCRKLGIKHTLVKIDSIKKLMKGSALTDNIEVPEGHYEEPNMKLTVVPNRNMIFIAMATAYAISINSSKLYLGVHAGDHAIYPDCREEFIEKMNDVLAIANYLPIEIITPYLFVTKKEILQDGLKLGVNYKDTWTCYKGQKKACGKCGSCQERLEAFRFLGLKDPLEYKL